MYLEFVHCEVIFAEMTKIIIFTLLLAACSALPPRPVKVFGNFYKKSIQNVSPLGNRLTTSIENPLKETKVSFTSLKVKLH